MHEILGLGGALIIGLTLGVLGGGGSILTVPVFVYLLNIDPVLATANSLFVVGSTSLVGAVRNIQKGLVKVKMALLFVLPAMVTVFLTRRYLLPLIPDEIMQVGSFIITKGMFIMVLFGVVMLLAGLSMLFNKRDDTLEPEGDCRCAFVIAQGGVVGTLTGLVGAGGGFLIVPVLVLIAKLPMKNAVATSLLIIAINSLFGFVSDLKFQTIDWEYLLVFTALSLVGLFIGMRLQRSINGAILKKIFGGFVLLMSAFILIMELK